MKYSLLIIDFFCRTLSDQDQERNRLDEFWLRYKG